MENNNLNFEDDVAKGQYSRKLTDLLKDNNLDWYASPNIQKPEIFIHPKSGIPENDRIVSRISLQVREGKLSLGVSGYDEMLIQDQKRTYESRKYNYHKNDCNRYGRIQEGRWWFTHSFPDLESIANEMKAIEPLLLIDK